MAEPSVEHTTLPHGRLEDRPSLFELLAEINKRWPEPADSGTGFPPPDECGPTYLAKLIAEYAEALFSDNASLRAEAAKWKNNHNYSFSRACALLNALGGFVIVDPTDIDPRKWGNHEILEHRTEAGNWKIEMQERPEGIVE